MFLRRFKVLMEMAGAQGDVRKREGVVEATNALNAIGHAILKLGVKTNDVTRLEVTLEEAATPNEVLGEEA